MKKQINIKRMRFAFIIVIAIMPLTAVFAQDEPSTETFDDPSLPGWERSPEAVVQEGVLSIAPGNFAVKFGGYGGDALRLKVKYAGPGMVFIRYAMGEGGNYALILFDEAIVLEKVVQDQPSMLSEYPWNGPSGEWMQFQITTTAGQIQVSLDGETIITATDEQPLEGGEIGLWVEGEAAAQFDDLSISGAERVGETVAEEAQAPIEEEQAVPEGISPTLPAAGSVGVSDLMAELTSSQANPLELTTFIVNLSLSVVLSFILSRVYVHWGSSLSNRRRFAANFILITVTTTFIILVVRSSVALSLGLVGALSIVRFRAAIKEPEELAYLFFAISIGIGLGDNQRLITVLALAAAILVLGVMRLFRGRQADFNLHVTVASQGSPKVELESIMDALSPHCSQIRLMRFDDAGSALESSFLVEFRNMDKLKAAKSALRALSDSLEITFLDNKGIG
jgi:hypothetical protein